jgi:quercetin dioxygenase-like cupin family protein
LQTLLPEQTIMLDLCLNENQRSAAMSENQNFFNVDALEQGISRQLVEGMTTRVFTGQEAMISIVRIEPNKSGRSHSHPEEQWGFCFRGSGVRMQGGKNVEVSAGDFWRTPGNVEHSFTAGSDGAVVYDVFAPPRKEYEEPGAGFQ